MKFAAIAAIVLGICVAVATTAYAQGRHDDGPHGMPKDMPMATDSKGAPGPAGRHDDKPHGQKKLAAKTSDAKAAAQKGQDAK